MAEPRKARGKAAEIVTTEPVSEEGATDAAPRLTEHLQGTTDMTSPEQFNEHVKALVALYFEKEVQALTERITDLERLATEADAVSFSALEFPPVRHTEQDYQVYGDGEGNIPEYRSEGETESDGGVPWYRE